MLEIIFLKKYCEQHFPLVYFRIQQKNKDTGGNMLLTDVNNLPKFVFTGKKFLRRKEITDAIRGHIAVSGFLAMQNSQYGLITNLSRQFNVSRTFVYDAISSLKAVFSIIFNKAPSKTNSVDEKKVLSYILSLRLEGKCSIESISNLMKRFGLANNSTGFISQYLKHVGSLLPGTLINKEENIRLMVFASDEIFSKNTPILVTVDPVSSAILKMELSDTRKAKDWVEHWNCIENNGHIAVYLVSDEGSGLTSGHSQGLSDVSWQPDTFHTIAHRLGLWVDRFERSAYQAMEKEYNCQKKINSARSAEVISKRTAAYDAATQITHKKIELYEQFKYVYTGIIKELHVFDLNGNLRQRKDAEDTIQIYLDLIDTLNHKTLSGTINKIRKVVPKLLTYFDNASTIVKHLENTDLDKDALKTLCAGWQWHKRYIKSKKAGSRNYCQEHESFCLEIAEGYLQERYKIVKEQVYHDLNHIVQSSAMVECINSIIRPYLNTSRNQISQEMLNLIMFYHNHRRYNSGERANKTPHEILSGKKQEKDWLELLFETIDGGHASTGNIQYSLHSDFLFSQKKHDAILCCEVSDDYFSTVEMLR